MAPGRARTVVALNARDPDRRPSEGTTLIEEMGTKAYEPFLHEQRAQVAELTGDSAMREEELRRAQELFEAIGATLRAARVRKERPPTVTASPKRQ